MPSSCLATSTCLLGYRWLYVSIVVCTFSCPSRSAISSGEKPISTSRLAWLCPYGIIRTNQEIPYLQGFPGLSLFFFHSKHPYFRGYRKGAASSHFT